MKGAAYALFAAAAYVTTWVLSVDSRAPVRKLSVSHRNNFWAGVILICFGVAVARLATDDTLHLFQAALGAAACFAMFVLCHPSTNLLVAMAALILSLLADSAHFLEYKETVIFIICVYLASYAFCQPRVVNVFGRGSTLFSLSVAVVLSVVYWLDIIAISFAGRVILISLPFALMLTSHPDYLDPRYAALVCFFPQPFIC
jgi:hypothetical protein